MELGEADLKSLCGRFHKLVEHAYTSVADQAEVDKMLPPTLLTRLK